MLRIRVCGGLELEADGRVLPDALVGGRQGRLVFAFLVCERARAVRREELAELLWADRPPDSWPASLSAVISRLRRLLNEAGLDGAEAIPSSAGAYRLVLPPDTTVDMDELEAAVQAAEAGSAAGDVDRVLKAARIAEAIGARGFLADDCEWVDRQRELVRDLRVRAVLARSVAHLQSGAHGRAVEAARGALALHDTREAAYRQLMVALAAAGERAEALRVWERCRTTLVEELGVDPSPETEAVYRDILAAGPAAPPPTPGLPSGVVTFLLTDIVESSALWEEAPGAMAIALERHDALIAEVVAAHGGTLLKSKLEGDATVSVFARASDGVAAALAVLGALDAEDWPSGAEIRLRMALHTGEAFERGGDYFGPALNRAARLRSLGGEHEVLLSQAVTELVRDHLPPHAVLRDLGHRDLRGMARGENVYALSRAADESAGSGPEARTWRSTFVPPALPAALAGAGPFVGRADELQRLVDLWGAAAEGSPSAVFIGGEPGVGKSRLAAELATRAQAAGAVVLHGRCDEDLAAALHPFVEALRPVVPALGAARMASVRGVDELARVLPELTEVLPARGPAVRADPDTERLALFDAFASLLRAASVESPVLLVLDDLHWAGKTTLALLRHLLREAGEARLMVVGTYRDTELARTHPLAETLADLRRDGVTTRISLGGLASEDVDAYLDAVGIDDRALGRELAEITSGNPYFLIEVVRHVEEAGGTWSIGDLPEGVREATGRRLSRLAGSTNRALSVAAVAGTTFDLALVEQVDGNDLLDEIAEACHAGLVVEEPGMAGRFRFAHAIVRQVLLAELVTVKRARLHRQIAELLDAAPIVGDPDALLVDRAYHWSECASLGDAAKAVGACRRAADRAMERLAYEEAGDLYGMALQVVDDSDDPTGETAAGLHLARCDALLTAGDVASARIAIDALEGAAHGSERLAAWYTTYEGLLAVLAEPDRLTEIVQSIGAAASAMRAIGDLRGEARAHYVHASALERLGQIGGAERALDAALAAARTAGDRRLADSILAEAPPAALWGPSSVTRASGRCLDVVRVLRINGGAPAVESVALRCQAVLEALRGRVDAARKMIASARRTVERLGLAHRQLETEVMAGFIELLADEPTKAEALLRGAYEGLRERGLGGEAAQAAAFLGRALLLQDRVEEADDVAAEAEALAGSDLKAAIAWRGVRAETASRRGDSLRALELAHEAVDLASATDALLLVVDARLALATVLRATNDHIEADAEARRASEACDAKGATALAARARGEVPASELDASHTAGADPTAAPACAALEAARRWIDRFNRGALEEIVYDHATGFGPEDVTPLLEASAPGDGASNERDLARAYEGGVRFHSPQLLVDRGRIALLRWDARSSSAASTFLTIFGVDREGRLTDWAMFDPADRNAANQELDRRTPDELDVDNLAWRAARRFAAATNAKDLDAALAVLAPGYQRTDRRTGMAAERIDDPRDAQRTIFSLGDWAREDSVLELQGDRRALLHDVIWFSDGAVSDAEAACLMLVEVDEAGLIVRHAAFNIDDREVARAELRTGGEGARPTSAWRSLQRFADAVNAHDWDAFMTSVAPGYALLDRRRGVTAPDGTDPVDNYRVLFSLDDWAIEVTPIDAHGERRMLARFITRFRDRNVSEGEVESLNVVEVDDDERIAWQMTFTPDDREAALAALHAGEPVAVPTPPAPRENDAWRASLALRRAFEACDDWDGLLATLADDFELDDRRSGVRLHATGEAALLVYRTAFDLDEFRWEGTLVTTRGERLAVISERAVLSDQHAGQAEVSGFSLVESAPDGRVRSLTMFDERDLDGALGELDRRYQQQLDVLATAAPRPNQAWESVVAAWEAFDRRDWDGFVRCHVPAQIHDSRHRGNAHILVGSEAFRSSRVLWEMDEAEIERRLVATEGDRVALVQYEVHGSDGAVGAIEFLALNVIEIAEDGRIARQIQFDPEDADAAIERMHGRARASAPAPNAAARLVAEQESAFARRDWESFRAGYGSGFTVDDRKRTAALPFDEEQSIATLRYAFDLPGLQWHRPLVATRGDRLALARDELVSRLETNEIDYESSSLTLVELDADGRVARHTVFDIDGVLAAVTELDARAAALSDDPAIPRNLAARSVGRDGWVLSSALGDRVCVHETPESLVVHEVDQHGAIVAEATFDLADRRGAADEAARRFHQGAALPEPEGDS